MWLHHAPYILHAVIENSAQIRVDVYTLVESSESVGHESKATLQHQKRITISSQCSQKPRILYFAKLCSSDNGSIQPHLFVHDSILEQLECHLVELKSQSLIASIGIDLLRLQCMNIVSSSAVVIILKGNSLDQHNVFDLLEWTPKDQRLLQGRLETDHIAGIIESYHSQPWYIFYTSLVNPGYITISPGSSLVTRPNLRNTPTPTIHTNMIPLEYRKKLTRITTSTRYQNLWNDPEPSPGDRSFKHIWAQTRTGELVHFKQGLLRWSTNLITPAIDIILAECQAPDRVSLLCLLVHTESAYILFDAMAGRMIKSWPNDNGDIVLSDLRNVGVYSMLILPEKSVQQPIPCLIYPNPDYSVMSSSTSSKQGDHVRAIANMDSTLGALERQLELRRKKIQHFEQLLTSKKQIIQDCQEVLDGPLRFAFNTGHLSEDAMPPEVVAIFQKRKSERRKQILERLIPIVGETAMTEFTLDTRVEGDIAEHSIHPLHVLECASGWITSSVGGVAWVGTNVENQSNQSLFNIRLSISLSCSHGRSLSQLEPGSTGLLISFVRMGVSDIYDDHDDCFDLSLVTKRLMSGSVQLHLDRKLDQKGPEMYHSTVPITNITFLEYCPKIWRSALDDIILPYSIRCQLNGITAKRFSVLAQDGLLLSLSDENTTFGSMEEDLIVKIVPSAHSLISGKHENSLDVLFRAKTEALAVEYAKKAALLCSRFV